MARMTRNPLRHTLLATAGRRIRAATAGDLLRGHALVVAQVVWLAVAALTVALYMASTGIWLGQVRARCVTGLCAHGRRHLGPGRPLAGLHLSVAFSGWYHFGLNLLLASGFAVIAALLFWRRSRDPLALGISLALLLFGVLSPFTSGPLDPLVAGSPGWRMPVELLQFVGAAALGILGYVFPDGRFVPRWTVLVAVAWALWVLPIYVFPDSPFNFSTWSAVAFFAVLACFLCAAGATQVYRFRRFTTPVQRQQTKWVIFGLVAAFIGYLAGWLVDHLPLTLSASGRVLADLAGGTLIYASLLLIPICTGIAILRHHLFDIDVLIRRTLIYSLVTGTLATVYAISGTLLQAAFVGLTGQGSAVALVLSTLAIAALLLPVRRQVQTTVDRRFYRRKYDAARILAEFSATLHNELDPAQVRDKLVVVVKDTMQPSQVSLWLAPPPFRREPTAWQRVDAAEGEAARLPKPAPLPGLFAAPDEPKS